MLPLRRLEIRRHAKKASEPGSDMLSAEGIEQAHALGRRLRIGYTHLYSSGAQRATQTLACLLAGMGRFVLQGVEVRAGLGSARESEWREAARAAQSAELGALERQNEALVREESERLAAEMRSLLAALPEGGYALAIGHSPLAECAVYGLTGKPPAPLAELEGFLVVEHKGGRLDVEELRGAA